MTRAEDLEREVRERIESADWRDIVPRLQAYTRAYLAQYGEPDGRRWQDVTHSYVTRAVERLSRNPLGTDHGATLFELVCAAIRELVEDDEARLQEILGSADWENLIPRVIARTVRDLGPATSAHGMSPADYVYEAVLHLYTHRRHFPHYRLNLSLFTFLCNTVYGMRTNDMAKAVSEGLHLTIVGEDDHAPARGELSARRLPPARSNEDAAALHQATDFLASLEPDLRAYAALRAAETYDSAKEYATALGVSEQTIRNYDRRLRRRRAHWDALAR